MKFKCVLVLSSLIASVQEGAGQIAYEKIEDIANTIVWIKNFQFD